MREQRCEGLVTAQSTRTQGVGEGAVVLLILVGVALLVVPMGLPQPGIMAVAGPGVIALASLELLLKRISAQHPPALLVWSLYLMRPLLAPCLPSQPWRLPQASDAGLLLGVSLCGQLGQFFLVRAFCYLPQAQQPAVGPVLPRGL